MLPPPGLDLAVVTREQHTGDTPAAKLCRPGVVRVLESPAELGRERLELARPLGERARKPTRDRVEEHHGGQVAVGEDVWPERDRVGAEVLDDPFVEALEPRREERDPLLLGEL